MSLINDALKKAQRDRSGGVPASVPTPGGGTRPPIESSRGSSSGGPNWLLVGGGALAGIALAGGAFWLLRPSTEPAAPARAAAAAPATVATAKLEPIAATPTAPAPTATPATTSTPPPSAPATVALTIPPAPAAAKPAPAAEQPTATAPAPQITAAPATASTPTVAPSAPTVAKTEPVAPALQLPEITVTSPTSTPAKSSKRLAEIVDALRVSGIRASARDTKVLMNERVYRLGDIVDHDLGIKLTGATPNSLTFTDASGATYTRNF